MVERKSATFSREQLEQAGYGRLLEQGSAVLPLDQMLMMDRITRMENTGGNYDRGVVEAELDINPKLWFFDCHFHEDPVMPGCLGLDALWQLLGFFMTWLGNKGKGRALGAEQIRFYGEVTPDSKIVKYILHIKRVIVRGATCVGLGDGFLFVDGKEVYSAKGLRVGIFPRTFALGTE